MGDEIFCPLVDKEICIVDCSENRDIKEEYISEEYKAKNNYKNDGI